MLMSLLALSLLTTPSRPIADAVALVDARTFTQYRPLLSARVPNRAERILLKACLMLNTFGQAGDTSSTIRALQIPGFREANPILRPIAHNTAALIAVKGTYWAASTYLFIRTSEQHPRWTAAAACAAGSLAVGATLHNRRLMKGR